MRTIILLYLGYALMFWGATMIAGGPNNTGSWPILYTLAKLGSAPATPPTKGGSQETAPTSNYTASNFTSGSLPSTGSRVFTS
jgi:hypothetical protein